MIQNAINKMEERVRKDGSLSEERKSELLSLLTTMKPEMTKLYKSQEEYVGSMIRSNNNNEVSTWKKNK
ncbi:MAG: hypothetical protein ABR936_07485 [Bacteroidota bacterium]|jgi:hypothetical protein